MKKSSENWDWKIEFRPSAARELKRLPKEIQERILDFLRQRLPRDPRSLGDALQGELKGLWRYRIGHYRVICRIEDERITVVVARIGHRGEVYRD